MPGFTVAVIDMGSNSFRMQISQVMDGTYKVVEDYKEVLRVGDGVFQDAAFSTEAVTEMIATLQRMVRIMENMKVAHYRAVGTAPFRDATNTDVVLAKIYASTGIKVEVISGTEEARLTYLAATGHFDLSGVKALFVDIGGGSTELSYSDNGELLENVSTQLGCSRLTQTFVKKNKARPEEITTMRKHIEQELKHILHAGTPNKLIFTGGTANTLAQVHARRNFLPDTAVKYVETTFLDHFVNELACKNYEDRAKIPGLEANRADISLACAMIVQFLVSKYDTEGFFTFSGGLRNGVTIDLLNRLGMKLLFQDDDLTDIRYSRLVETGRKYHFEEEHALQVTRLTKKLFEDAHDALGLDESSWEILEAAAILHDIGQHISYSEHHKHSQYLIQNTELIGYSHDEKELIAHIARYHRRTAPKKAHLDYQALSEKNRKLVYKLAALLRLADVLDRSHTSIVKTVSMSFTKDNIIVEAYCAGDISMEMGSLAKKADMLETVTGKKLLVKQVDF